MSKGTRAQIQNLTMEQAVKNAVEDAFQVSGIVTKSDMDELMETLEKRIKDSFAAELEAVTKPFANRIEALEAKVAMYEAHFEELELKIDNAEQYSRRSSLRLYNLPLPEDGKETSNDCMNKVKELFKEMEVSVPDSCIDRVHRVGQIKTPAGSSMSVQPVIMKFTSFRSRVQVYRARKKLQNVKFGLDLTPRRKDLLSHAQNNVKNNPKIEFAFADINCRVGLKLKHGGFKFFNTKSEFYDVLNQC